MAELEVQLSANINKLERDLSKAGKVLSSLEVNANKTKNELANLGVRQSKLNTSTALLEKLYKSGRISLDRYNRSSALFANSQKDISDNQKSLRVNLRNTLSTIKDLKSSNNTNAGGFDSLNKSAANANPTLQEFSRVIQDAPFGIQGVGNNITQLVSQFGNLSKSTGGAKNAFKSLLGAFTGAGGILFAVSTVVSLLTVFGDKLKFATSATKELTNASKDFVAEAVTERLEIQRLFDTTRDLSRSYSDRVSALEKLQKKYPDYLKNLTLETVNSTQAANAVANLSKSLIENAKIKGIEANISGKITDRSVELTESLVKQEKAAESIRQELGRLEKKYADYIDVNEELPTLGKQTSDVFDQINKNLGGASSGIGNRLQELVSEYTEASNNVNKVTKDIENSTKDLSNALQKIDLKKALNIQEVYELPEVVLTPKTNKGKAVADAKETVAVYNQVFQDEFAGAFSARTLSQGEVSNTFGGFIPSNAGATANKDLTVIEDRYANFKDRLTATTVDLSGNIASGFAQIGAALAQGDKLFSAVGDAILSTLGGIITQLGQAIISAGVGAIALKKLFVNPYLAVAAGGVLVAIGAALSSAQSAVSSVGGQSSNTSFQGSTYSSSYSTTDGNNFMSNFKAEIEGTKLILVQERVASMRNRNNSKLFG